MTTRAALVLILTFALSLQIAVGQTNGTPPPAKDWQQLSLLKSGDTILVELKDGRTLEVKFVGVEQTKLFVSDLDRTTTGHFEQNNIQRVYFAKSNGSRKKRAKIGAIIGSLAGLVIGTAVAVRIDDSSSHRGMESVALPVGMGFGAAGGAAGYGIGYALGGTRKKKLLYESQ